MSLVGHLATRFAAHPENLATESLAYVLRNSQLAHTTFISHLSEFVSEIPMDLTFQTQVTGDDNAIPDLVGINRVGRPQIIAEAKFWAGLTDNQPLTYLDRLPTDSSGLLVFIAPESRFQTLWPELMRRCQATGPLQSVTSTDNCYRLQDCRHRWLALTSWRKIINIIDSRLAAAGEDHIRADLQQLAGLCNRMDSEAFLPVRSEELSPLIGRRIIEYCNLIDDVVNKLVSEGIGDTKGLRKTGMSGRWGRYISLKGNGCFLHFCSQAWSTLGETPLWLSVKDHKWRTTAELKTALLPLEREVPSRLLRDSNDQLMIPLFLPIGTERDAVIANLIDQILQVVKFLPDHVSEPASNQTPDPEVNSDALSPV